MSRDKTPQPPMRRIRYEMGHAISGYPSDSSPAYFTNLKAARAAAVEEVGEYLEALGAYDDHGKRYPVGHENHVSVTKEGPYKWRLSFGIAAGRYVYVADVDEALYFDDLGDVYAKETTPEGHTAWVEMPTDY